MFKEALIPGVRSLEMRVELDKKSLFALASDTRLDILRSLQPMRRTVTQLAETLGIDKAAVHRHLKKLEEGGLVIRYEEHGFVYYGLSWKARDLMSPNENTRIIVMLSSSWLISVIVAFLVIASFMTAGLGGDQSGLSPATGGNNYETDGSGQMQPVGAQAPLPWFVFLAPAVALAAVAVTFVLLSSKSMVRPKQPLAAESDPRDDRTE